MNYTSDGRLFVYRQGSGEPLLLLHGLLGSHAYWDRVIEHIPIETYEVIAPDLLGFGRSAKPTNARYNIDDHVAAIESDVLSKIAEPVTIVGHSMGAMIALRLAVKHPDRVKKLVLVNLPFFVGSKQARHAVRAAMNPFQRAYIGRLGWILCSMSNNLLRGYVTKTLSADGQDLPAGVIRDYSKHNWQSFKRSLVRVVFNHSVHEDLQNCKSQTKFIYSVSDPFLTAQALEIIESWTDLDTVELVGEHRLPLARPKEVAFEICN